MRRAIPPSLGVARLLRKRREEMQLTLRQVEAQTKAMGELIPFTIIAKVERGLVDPGFRRLNVLLRLYHLPLQMAGDLAEVEQLSGELPIDPAAGFDEAIKDWKAGDSRRSIAYLLALRTQSREDSGERLKRQKALVAFAGASAAMGKHRLALHILEELLLDPLEPGLLVQALIQAGACWDRLGSGEVAQAFLARAESHVAPRDHRQRAWVKHTLASVLISAGRFDEAEAELSKAIEAYRAAKDSYGESNALGVRVRLHFEREDFPGALKAARAAQRHAEEHGHARLRVMRKIDEGRCLFALKDIPAGIQALNEGLSGAVALQDGMCRFYAHYYLWKAYQKQGDVARADLELRAAQYYISALDEASAEAVEVRQTLGDRRPGRRRPGRRSSA
jgi:tetratricopeptide (TPR) repeat protein